MSKTTPTRITLDVLPDGMVRITSTCMGRPDAAYASMADSRIAPEVQKLLSELRQRLQGYAVLPDLAPVNCAFDAVRLGPYLDRHYAQAVAATHLSRLATPPAPKAHG